MNILLKFNVILYLILPLQLLSMEHTISNLDGLPIELKVDIINKFFERKIKESQTSAECDDLLKAMTLIDKDLCNLKKIEKNKDGKREIVSKQKRLPIILFSFLQEKKYKIRDKLFKLSLELTSGINGSLLLRGYDIVNNGIDTPDDYGWTLLHKACNRADYELVKLLIQHSAAVNVFTKNLQTPLHFAVRSDHPLVAELIVKSGACIDAIDKEGSTPLHEAVKAPYLLGVKVLLNNNANPNAKNISHETPLHLLVQHYRADCSSELKLLIKKGAHVNAQDIDKRTPLHYAVLKRKESFVSKLIKLGADITIADKCGKTALKLAQEKNYQEIMNLLQ